MKPGTQIAYVPTHAKGFLTHPDVEFGFVTSESPRGHAHFCRYWHKGSLGTLRTLANSELTFDRDLVKHESVPQHIVDDLVARFARA